jgi:hypothetical protein
MSIAMVVTSSNSSEMLSTMVDKRQGKWQGLLQVLF